MLTTKAFCNGGSQAVQIPAELAYERIDIKLENERIGDEIRIRPAHRRLTAVLQKFAAFGPNRLTEDRGQQEQSDRSGS